MTSRAGEERTLVWSRLTVLEAPGVSFDQILVTIKFWSDSYNWVLIKFLSLSFDHIQPSEWRESSLFWSYLITSITILIFSVSGSSSQSVEGGVIPIILILIKSNPSSALEFWSDLVIFLSCLIINFQFQEVQASPREGGVRVTMRGTLRQKQNKGNCLFVIFETSRWNKQDATNKFYFGK